MARTAASRAASGATPLLGIGQVLARLQPEFPELTPSKLRFLEEQGLISPARTPSGYRKFAPADVERIAFVLSMQRDHYLPLKVIRAHLETIDAGETPALPGATSAPAAPRPRRFRRDELAREAGAPPALIDDAVSAALLPAADHYGEEALTVLRSLAALRAVGIEPRHLRSVRVAAEREAALVEQAIAPSRRADPADKARSLERALELGRHLETLHASMVRQTLVHLGR
ncbi:MerR family DNA-binding transcriptional regulator [Agromyces sp. CFH 90414]|uniref:MerR family DNA-binding transcriptional regulator n=1 Tax=Agromyces agglutinans TaxID=2662258 RepID=A0A6I2FA50_9MICO|nr:MerR family transcriptional regulator [Agromyces agglutinans]MRG61772.1 MerR family DNA-binding transcriptional regulator [Agromyces agglutinans]